MATSIFLAEPIGPVRLSTGIAASVDARLRQFR
jgi:hypothetical protein